MLVLEWTAGSHGVEDGTVERVCHGGSHGSLTWQVMERLVGTWKLLNTIIFVKTFFFFLYTNILPTKFFFWVNLFYTSNIGGEGVFSYTMSRCHWHSLSYFHSGSNSDTILSRPSFTSKILSVLD